MPPLCSPVVDERVLCERLITYDTSTAEGIQSAAGFIKGWLEARDIDVRSAVHKGRPVLAATVGAADGPTVVLHGHLDVVPGRAEQFQPRTDGDRLLGRGAYDMKGGLAGMMCATRDLASQGAVRVLFACVSDEETDDDTEKGSDWLIGRGYRGDFAITGEPTDFKIGVQAKGVLAVRIEVAGKAAHGSTPWLGDNAVLKAFDVFRQIESLPFARESSEMFDRPSINLGRILGGDALNKVPDACAIDVDIRYLPGQDRREILAAIDATARRQRPGPLPARPRAGGGRQPAGAGARPRGRPGEHAGPRVGRPRRRLRRGELPERRRPGGGVRAGRWWPPRARRVGVDRVAVGLPAGARGLRDMVPEALGVGRLRIA